MYQLLAENANDMQGPLTHHCVYVWPICKPRLKSKKFSLETTHVNSVCMLRGGGSLIIRDHKRMSNVIPLGTSRAVLIYRTSGSC